MDTYSYRWHPFQDLPDTWSGLSDQELSTLRKVWLEQKGRLESAELVSQFTTRLIRQYAIEGGIIERAYTLDRGVTQVLIDRGIDASLIPRGATDKDPRHVARIIQAHQDTVETVFELIKGNRQLTVSVIKQLHAALLQHETTIEAIDSLGRLVDVPLVKGAWKTLPNNPMRPDGSIHEYCPPEHVASEMDRLIASHVQHEKDGVPAEVEAAWLHHAFTQIHPFQDGNGRIARLIASFVFIRHDYFPLTLVDEKDRDIYISALEAADQGDLADLIAIFSKVQRRTFVKVLGIAGSLRDDTGIEQIIASARQTFVSRHQAQENRIEASKTTAGLLLETANAALKSIATRLQGELGTLSPKFRFRVDSEANGGTRQHYFRNQVVALARELEYFANPGMYHSWARLILQTDDQAEILVTFHGIGYEYRGVLVAAVAFYRRVEVGNRERETTETTTASDTAFQINYEEAVESVRKRFDKWLAESVTRAMESWRKSL